MTIKELQERLADMMIAAQKKGADQADGVVIIGTSQSFVARKGQAENVDWSNTLRLGLRVIMGHRQACVTANSVDPTTLNTLVDQAITMARVVPEDPYCGLADVTQLARNVQAPALDETVPSLEQLKNMALEAEAAALNTPGVTMSEGATASWGQSEFVLATTHGFSSGYRSSSFGVSVAALAGSGTQMQLDGYGAQTRFLADLENPQSVGKTAGERAVKRLNPRKAPTGKFPVVYENLLSSSLLGTLLGGILGSAIVEKTSFLQNALETSIFPSTVTIVDDPLLAKGLSSHPFDGECLPVQKRIIVDKGVLKTWLLNLRTARALKLSPTGHGTVALGRAPGIQCSNFYMEAGSETVDELLRSIPQGFFVTDVMGHTINGLTGDYSLGASGFWIEGGVIAYPVQGLTIAGNLRDMFHDCTPANDLMFRSHINAPTLRISQMTIAGG